MPHRFFSIHFKWTIIPSLHTAMRMSRLCLHDSYNPASPGVTMITEETYPYASTTESYDYAKEVTTLTTQVPYGENAVLGEEGPTECDCEPGEPGFAGFPGPKVPQESFGRILVNYAVVLKSYLILNRGLWGHKENRDSLVLKAGR